MARRTSLTEFSPPPLPLISGGEGAYTMQTVQRLAEALQSTQRMTPQAATKAPNPPIDGMVRLARWPWWPVAGQTADAWVYYDGEGSVWRHIGTDPTSSH